MAALTDEEKAKAILGEVEPEKAAEPVKEPDTQPEEAQLPQDDTSNDAESPAEPEEPEKPAAEEEAVPEAPQSFTKQFPNLKGETLAEYVPELEKAYDNSFKESLRLNKQWTEAQATIEEAKRIIAGVQAPPTPAAPETPAPQPTQPAGNTLQLAINELPEIQRIRAQDTQAMFSAFDDFAKSYPQAREEDTFDTFQKASDGISAALTSTLGRIPTYPELFKAIAGSLGWQATAITAKKDNAIKESMTTSQTVSSTVPKPKQPRVSDAQVDAYMKMFTSKTREEAVKELAEVV